jgi:hypothetical protein
MVAKVELLDLGANNAAAIVAGFAHWLRTHRGAAMMASLFAFAVPVTFFPGAVSAMRDPTVADLLKLSSWYVLYGAELSCLLLVVGYSFVRFRPKDRYARSATLLVCACAAAACVEVSTAGRGEILIEQGVAESSQTMNLYGFVSALIMALLFFAHLERSRTHEQAAARLAAAQAAQLESRRRLVRSRLQSVQARIDPQVLFDILEAVRRSYDADPSRAEQLLDELVAFLRAVVPRINSASSSVTREAELARMYIRLRTLAGATNVDMRLDVPAELMNARFPPGVLLPLLDDALRARGGACRLTARRSSDACQLVLALPARPSNAAVERVARVLADLYGPAAELTLSPSSGTVSTTVKVPYECA